MVTISFGTLFISFELQPAPIHDLVGEDGGEDDFGDGAGEGFVELRLGACQGVLRGYGEDELTVRFAGLGVVEYGRVRRRAWRGRRRDIIVVTGGDVGGRFVKNGITLYVLYNDDLGELHCYLGYINLLKFTIIL